MDVLRGDDDVEKTELFGWCLSVGGPSQVCIEEHYSNFGALFRILK